MTIYKTFEDLAKVFKIKNKAEKQPTKSRKCRKCGAKMVSVDGTNVFVCDNPQCDNYALTSKKNIN